ncbi:hypothetical protein B0H17DRAFT_1208667 [Mycena rosella]|uniref:Uncharacterized protein n=1 Tax=Mycena rosella TaxID=1033263 RepID=A0AAD7D051_MYCRO|nr:hypothetical protein B0H17DRAFT_1208667 [Mycena rosella]
MAPSTPRPSHRHSDSSPALVFTRPPEDHQKPANRIMTSVRRTLSTAKRRDPAVTANTSIYSTPAERNPYNFRYETPAAARPTVEQIAMGLHLSRTPHLRGPPKYPAPASHPQPARPSVPLPPPPARSSLKHPKSALVPPSALVHGGSTSSTTDVTSTAPSTPHSSDRSSLSLRARMSRFLPHRNPGPAPGFVSTVSSPRTSSSEVDLPRKKAVRFSSIVQEED